MMIRSTFDNWKRNLETIVQWSPYESEEDLLLQVFSFISLVILQFEMPSHSHHDFFHTLGLVFG